MATYQLYWDANVGKGLNSVDGDMTENCKKPHHPFAAFTRMESDYEYVTWSDLLVELQGRYNKTGADLAVGDVLEIIRTPSFSLLEGIGFDAFQGEAGLTFDLKYDNGVNTPAVVSGIKAKSVYGTVTTSTIGNGSTSNYGAVVDKTAEVVATTRDNNGVGNDGLDTYMNAGKAGLVTLTLTAVPANFADNGRYGFRANYRTFLVCRSNCC